MHGVVSSTAQLAITYFFSGHLDYQLFYYISQIPVYHNRHLCKQNFNFDTIQKIYCKRIKFGDVFFLAPLAFESLRQSILYGLSKWIQTNHQIKSTLYSRKSIKKPRQISYTLNIIHLSFTDFNLKIKISSRVLILIFRLKSVNDTFIVYIIL